ncbi:MAG: MMPL family transporter [Deltaproteobacteria bacterium]|nr:MMPL family transporter [Deltaproteobacteria bacterium]
MNRLLRLALDRPRTILLLTGSITVVLAVGMLRLELRVGGDALRPEGDPAIEHSARDASRFLDPRTVWLLVSTRPEQDSLATPSGFRYLRELQRELAELDVLRPAEILSLASLPRLQPGARGIAVEGSLERIPEDPRAFAALLAELRGQPLTDGLLLDSDGQRALFSLPLSETASLRDAVAALERFTAAGDRAFELTLGGPLIAEMTLGERVLHDLAVLVPLMLLAIVVLLYLMLRTPTGVVIPLIETGIVLVWTFGAMGWLGAPIALVTTILPVVLMAMCITDEIHLLERLAGVWGEGTLRGRLETALSEVGRPIVLTSLTTAMGFLSFRSASIAPLRDFGSFAAFGILSAMFLTFSFIPALIVLLPERWSTPPAHSSGARGLKRFGRLAARRPRACFGAGLAALVVVLPGLRELQVSDSWVENFDPDDTVVRAERGINASFWGSYRLDVVFEGAPGHFHRAAGARLMESVAQQSKSLPHVGGAQTYLSTLAPIANALGVEDALSQLSDAKLSDLFTVAEMSQSRADLRSLVAVDGSAARARLYVRSANYAVAQELERALDTSIPALVGTDAVDFHYSGDLPSASALVESIVYNQLRSVGWALATVSAILLLFSRRLTSLYAMAPVLAACAGVFGVMGLAGVELGIATSMFASLAVGVGVDFGIHFQHRFEREREGGADPAAAIAATFDKAGRALGWNAVVLAAGFLVLIASDLKPNHSLGLLLAFAVLVCCAESFLLLPLLLRRSVGSAALIAALAFGMLPGSARAEPILCDQREDPDATALMAEIEHAVRATPIAMRMQIETRFRGRLATAFTTPMAPKTAWGLVNGDPDETWLLFVFTGPGQMAGTSLLIRDVAHADPKRPEADDAMWFYLNAFQNFSRLGSGGERSVIPSTSLTYADARGFFATNLFHFRNAERSSDSDSPWQTIAGCPRTPAIAATLGYGAIAIEVDAQRALVRSVNYQRPGGASLKSYRVTQVVKHGDRHYPKVVELEHAVEGFDNHIEYEYWPADQKLPAALFRPDIEQETFLARMRRHLEARELGERFAAEIEAAAQRVREHDERFGVGSKKAMNGLQ